MLGVEIRGPENGRVLVSGRGLDGLTGPEDVLDFGNSGNTMRLLTGILTGQPFFCVITGDDSFRRRPIVRVTGPLSLIGARIEGRQNGNLAPLGSRMVGSSQLRLGK